VGDEMSTESRVEGCLVRKGVAWPELTRALSEVLEISPDDIAPFDTDNLSRPPSPVLVKCIERESGFRLDLTFYIGAEIQSALAGVALASRLAKALGQEILTSPPDEPDGGMPSPALWVLALPGGELYLVHQINPDSDAVEIDRSPEHMKRIRPPRMN
jgi:hypothetical protein